MLHLAQVQTNESIGGLELRLLARRYSENSWGVINPESISPPNPVSQNEGVLVLVELSENKEVLRIEDATDWIVDIVQNYLTIGVTPPFLEEEAKRTEQWRQDLTLQSQDLTRRHLEMEARREQIQDLEQELKVKEQHLEMVEAQLKSKEEDLQKERQHFDQMSAQLQQQKQELETMAAQFEKQKAASEVSE